MQLKYLPQDVSHFAHDSRCLVAFIVLLYTFAVLAMPDMYCKITITNPNSSVAARRDAIWLPSACKQLQSILTCRA